MNQKLTELGVVERQHKKNYLTQAKPEAYVLSGYILGTTTHG